jgi:hypothetical protein
MNLFECKYCKRTFKKKYNMERHIDKKHIEKNKIIPIDKIISIDKIIPIDISNSNNSDDSDSDDKNTITNENINENINNTNTNTISDYDIYKLELRNVELSILKLNHNLKIINEQFKNLRDRSII